MPESTDIKLALWNTVSKSGNVYLGSSKPYEIGGKKYWVKAFPNLNKQNERAPDFNIILTPTIERE
jgi:hypothetical protein